MIHVQLDFDDVAAATAFIEWVGKYAHTIIDQDASRGYENFRNSILVQRDVFDDGHTREQGSVEPYNPKVQ